MLGSHRRRGWNGCRSGGPFHSLEIPFSQYPAYYVIISLVPSLLQVQYLKDFKTYPHLFGKCPASLTPSRSHPIRILGFVIYGLHDVCASLAMIFWDNSSICLCVSTFS